MRSKIRKWIDTLSAAIADKYGQSINRIVELPAGVIRWLFIYAIPVVIGTKAKDFIEAIPVDKSIIDLQVWITLLTDHWILLPLSIFFLIGLFWRNKIEFNKSKIRSIQDALTWMYYDLGFDQPNYELADIRCTIWVPVHQNQKPDSFRMRQLLSYIPTISKPSTSIATSFRKNKPPGRIFRFTKIGQDGKLQAIGIAGLCIIDFFTKSQPATIRERIPNDVDFVNYMIDNWNFTLPQAERLTNDRRSYMCAPLMDRTAKKLYGIIYLDSCDPDALPARLGTRIEKKYLHRIAQLFVY